MPINRPTSSRVLQALALACFFAVLTACNGLITDLVGSTDEPAGKPDLTVSRVATSPSTLGAGT